MNAETIDQQPIQSPERASVITIPAYKLERFQAKVDSANRRLENAGSDARFEFTYEEFFAKKTIGGQELPDGKIFGGTVVEVPWIAATQASELNLTIGDYTFLAALVAEEVGVTVHTAPGHELGGFEPAGDLHCDHCNINRDRVRLYLVRENETGRILQLGHSCIELFTGFSPKGLFALQFDEELRGLGNDDEAGGYGQRDFAAGVDQVVALAWAYSNEGRSYISAKIEWKIGTGAKVRGHIFGGFPRQINFGMDQKGVHAFNKAVAEYEAAEAKAAQLVANPELLAEIKAIVSTVDENTDYGRNLRVVLAGERVSSRNIGILASVVSVYSREKELAAERAAAPATVQGFLAEVGTRIKTTIEITVKVARQREGDYGWSTWVVGTAQDGHTVAWNASRRLGTWVAVGGDPTKGDWRDLEPGDTLILSAATVKAHENYKGTDQTILTRAKVAE